MRVAVVLGLCFLYALLNVAGTALIKQGAVGNELGNARDYLIFFLKPAVIGGVLLNFCSMLVVVKALAIHKFIYVFPVAIGINFALTILTGYVVFSEKLSSASFAGLVLILAGISLMSVANR